MEKTKGRIYKQLKSVTDAFLRYPASILCAAILAIVMFVSIESRTPNERLLVSLVSALVFGMFFNMAVAAALQRFRKDILTFWMISGAGFAVTIGTWMLLYFPFSTLPTIGVARVVAASAISFIAFLLIASVKVNRFDTNHMVYMTIKSFFISLLYFLVLWAGLSLVAFSIRALIYSEMSSNIFAHIAVLSQFISFIFFLANYPLFNSEEDHERIESAIKQPRFIEILFQNILIPIILILSMVLFIWAVRIVAVGTVATFFEITFIFNAFSIVGIILYFLTSHYENAVTKIYRRSFPIAAIVFLAFLTYKIYLEIAERGLRVNSYFVILLWILTALSSLIFIFKSRAKNWLCLALAAILIGVSVMPVIGFRDLPINMQILRLERILNKNDMLKDGEVVPNSTISKKDKSAISDSVSYLYSYQNSEAKKPKFLKSKNVKRDFAQIFGFESHEYIPDTRITIAAQLKYNVINISEYDFVLFNFDYTKIGNEEYVEGSEGKYSISLTNNNSEYWLTVRKNGTLIIETSLKPYFEDLIQRYHEESSDGYSTLELDDDEMNFTIQKDGVKIKVLFSYVSASYDNDTLEIENYYVAVQGIYLAE